MSDELVELRAHRDLLIERDIGRVQEISRLETEIERLTALIGEAREALEPFANMADAANMHDPISKWLRIAHLQDAREVAAKLQSEQQKDQER